jgi:hypothetical protein
VIVKIGEEEPEDEQIAQDERVQMRSVQSGRVLFLFCLNQSPNFGME